VLHLSHLEKNLNRIMTCALHSCLRHSRRRRAHGCDNNNDVSRFVRPFLRSSLAGLACYVRSRPVFINYYGNIRDIFFRLLIKYKFPPSLLSLASCAHAHAFSRMTTPQVILKVRYDDDPTVYHVYHA